MFKTDDITVLFAGAGCGKSTYMISRVKKELETCRPEETAFVSYTRKGVSEGKEKLVKILKIDSDRLPYVQTLHALTYQALGYTMDNIFSDKHARKFNEILGFNLTLNKQFGNNTEDDKYLERYEIERNGVFEDGNKPVNMEKYKRFVHAYEAYKKKYAVYDFMDCLVNFVKAGKSLPVKVAFIDEAQDITATQWEVCYTAFAQCERVYIAGDDYQSIYTYAGARPDILINIAQKHKIVKLETSYRISKKVYEYAKGITDFIGRKMDKDYAPFKDVEGVVEMVQDRNYLIQKVKASSDSWFFLFRNNYFISDFEKLLQEAMIPYHNSNGFFICASDLARINKYYNFRKAGYQSSKAKEDFMKQYQIKDMRDCWTESNLIYGNVKYLYLGYVERYGLENLIKMSKEAKPRILCSTVHKVKGAEAKNVAVFLDCTRRVYYSKFTSLDSELRLLYVAFTRSEENLYIVGSQNTYGLDDIVLTVKEHCNL